jgi:hypothetical protein
MGVGGESESMKQDDWLNQHWVHAHEEDTADTRVFRPSSFPLPPSRGRRTLDLRTAGALTQSRPGPDDRRAPESGGWSLDGHTLTLRSDRAGVAVERLEVVSLANDRLVLRKA